MTMVDSFEKIPVKIYPDLKAGSKAVAKQIADFIREKKWHTSQQLKNLSNGSVELTLRLSSLIEVQRWILSWAGNAEVIAPLELRDAVRLAGARIATMS